MNIFWIILLLTILYCIYSRFISFPKGVKELVVSIDGEPSKIYFHILDECKSGSIRSTTYALQDEVTLGSLRKDGKDFFIKVSVKENGIEEYPKVSVDIYNFNSYICKSVLQKIIYLNTPEKMKKHISSIIRQIEESRLPEFLGEKKK